MAGRVLVVDDDVNLHILLHVLLTRAGYAVEFASDGPAAVQKMQDGAYDAILLDLLLPTTTGIQILQKMEREKPELLARVVVVSGAAMTALMEAKKYLVHAVIRKPFDIAELVDVVQACTRKFCV